MARRVIKRKGKDGQFIRRVRSRASRSLLQLEQKATAEELDKAGMEPAGYDPKTDLLIARPKKR